MSQFTQREINLRHTLGEDFDKYEFEFLAAGVEPSVDDEVAKGDGWSLGGWKGLRHWSRKKKGSGMTREEIFDRARVALLADWRTRHPKWEWGPQSDSAVYDMLAVLEALGLIKFDEPGAGDALSALAEANWYYHTGENHFNEGRVGAAGASVIAQILDAAGFEIRRKA